MKPWDVMQWLIDADLSEGSRHLVLAPGPLKIRIGHNDQVAAKLIAWMENEMGDGATVGDFEDVILAALWWLHLWATLEDE